MISNNAAVRDLFFRLFNLLGLLGLLRLKKYGTTTVLCFHRVTNEKSESWPALSPEVFAEIIGYLKKYYEIISLDDFFHTSKKSRNVLITFDDGYDDFFYYSLPILKQNKIPAVLSIVTNSIESENYIWTQRLNKILEEIKDIKNFQFKHKETGIQLNSSEIINIEQYSVKIFLELLKLKPTMIISFINELENSLPKSVEHTKMLNWEQINECLNSNVYIASHTHTHFNLALMQDVKLIEEELVNSKNIIKEKTGFDTQCLSFPNGMYNGSVISIAQNIGYKYLLAIGEKNNKHGITNDIIYRQLIEHKCYYENIFKIENFHNLVKQII